MSHDISNFEPADQATIAAAVKAMTGEPVIRVALVTHSETEAQLIYLVHKYKKMADHARRAYETSYEAEKDRLLLMPKYAVSRAEGTAKLAPQVQAFAAKMDSLDADVSYLYNLLSLCKTRFKALEQISNNERVELKSELS